MAIPFFYKLFYLYIEPLSALGGAIYAGFLPRTYLNDLTIAATRPIFHNDAAISAQVFMTLYQLSNLYLLFALNEHLVLSSTDNIRTWKRLLFGLLIADFGHLLSLTPLGPEVYWSVWNWNAMMWGSIGFVYLGAASRISFLLGVGLGSNRQKDATKKI